VVGRYLNSTPQCLHLAYILYSDLFHMSPSPVNDRSPKSHVCLLHRTRLPNGLPLPRRSVATSPPKSPPRNGREPLRAAKPLSTATSIYANGQSEGEDLHVSEARLLVLGLNDYWASARLYQQIGLTTGCSLSCDVTVLVELGV
jgi:hypothetical protein